LIIKVDLENQENQKSDDDHPDKIKNPRSDWNAPGDILIANRGGKNMFRELIESDKSGKKKKYFCV
jgi:hypothetical protein